MNFAWSIIALNLFPDELESQVSRVLNYTGKQLYHIQTNQSLLQNVKEIHNRK